MFLHSEHSSISIYSTTGIMKQNEAHMHNQCKVLLRAQYFLKVDLIWKWSKAWLVGIAMKYIQSLFHTRHIDVWDLNCDLKNYPVSEK